MNVSHDAADDMLYVEFRPGPGVISFELFGGIVIDIDAAGRVAGIELDRASERLDLDALRALAARTPAAAPGR